MALIGYARVSTVDQNPQLQLDALAAAGCERVFTEQASGARADRPELRAVLDYLRPGDVLVVWRLDRLGRSLQHLIATVTALGERGVGFRSLTEAIDTTTAAGRLLFHIMGALSEFERELIRERTMAGLAAAAAAGRTGGRPGLSDATVSAGRQLVAGGMTVDQAAKMLRVGRSTLYRYLQGDDPDDFAPRGGFLNSCCDDGRHCACTGGDDPCADALVHVDDPSQLPGQLGVPMP